MNWIKLCYLCCYLFLMFLLITGVLLLMLCTIYLLFVMFLCVDVYVRFKRVVIVSPWMKHLCCWTQSASSLFSADLSTGRANRLHTSLEYESAKIEFVTVKHLAGVWLEIKMHFFKKPFLLHLRNWKHMVACFLYRPQRPFKLI